MTKYLQTNEKGYVVNITDEPLLVGLFGGKVDDYQKIKDEQAENLQKLLKLCHQRGKGLHIDDVVF